MVNDNASENDIEKSPQKSDRNLIREHHSTGNVVWALFLIFIGTIFLLNTTGIVSWDVWSHIIRFWPVFLILAGIQVVFGHSTISTFLIAFISISLFSIIAIIGFVSINAPFIERWHIPTWIQNIAIQTGEVQTQTLAVVQDDYTDIDKRIVSIQFGVGEFTINDNAGTDYIYIDATYFERLGKPVLTQDQIESTLQLNLKQEKESTFFRVPTSPSYNIQLGQPDLLTNLLIDMGAGKGEITLDTASLENVNADVGAGSLRISIGKGSIPSKAMNAHIGAGEMTVTLSSDIAYNIDYNVGVGEVLVEGKSLGNIGASGQNYTSEDYDEAKANISIVVDVGVGSFKLVRK